MGIDVGSVIFDSDNNEYEVLDTLGGGSYGTVFKIKDNKTEKLFAVKTFRTDNVSNLTFKSLEYDFDAAIDINNENVIKYFYYHNGETFDHLPPYIVMEYADNNSLSKFLSSLTNNIQESDLINMYLQLISGMTVINETLIHRDIKPDNILLSKDKLKISDFGFSKLIKETTRTYTFKGGGTDYYKAPETWTHNVNTLKSDMYSMGIVFYELATREYPYKIKNYSYNELRNAHLISEPEIPSKINQTLSPLIDHVILKMMKKNSKDRFNDWGELKQKLLNKEISNDTNWNNEINRAVSILIKKNQKEEQIRNEQEEIRLKKDEYRNLIKKQFNDEIFSPLNDFINNINNNAEISEFVISISFTEDICSIPIRYRKRDFVNINLEILHDDEFYQEKKYRDTFNEIRVSNYYARPKLNNNSIMAWGSIVGLDRTGFNLLLIEDKESQFGKFYKFINRISAGVNVPKRPEPFAFERDELKRAIDIFGVMDVYESTIEDFKINSIFQYINRLLENTL